MCVAATCASRGGRKRTKHPTRARRAKCVFDRLEGPGCFDCYNRWRATLVDDR